jgi:DNA-binding GntR family transcriptional regulator
MMKQRTFLKDKAYEALKTFLMDGTYPPGTFLSERKLGGQLGMSKTPIRAALERLETEGFIATAPQQGIVVRELSLREIREHYEIRIALETYIVQQIAGKLISEQLNQLEENLAMQQARMENGDTLGHVEADADFHLLLADFLGNAEILKVMQHQRDKMFRVTVQISVQNPPRMESSLIEHTEIFDAIKNGDGDLAAERIKTHFETGKSYLLQTQ